MFMVLSSWHSHYESSPGSFDECRLSAGWPPTRRPSQPIWAVSPPKDWLLPSADTIAIYYYYSARKLILILPSHGGWKAESTEALHLSGIKSRSRSLCLQTVSKLIFKILVSSYATNPVSAVFAPATCQIHLSSLKLASWPTLKLRRQFRV